MAGLALMLTCLKAFTAFWSLVTMAVAAAMIDRFNYYYDGFRSGSGFDSGNAVLAAAIISLVYFVAVVVFLLFWSESILISVMVDTICLGFLWILVLGSVAALSANAAFFQACDVLYCDLGSATVGLGWILWFLIFGILAFQVAYTLIHYGTAYSTWRTPMAQLLVYGDASKRSTAGVESTTGAAEGEAVPMGHVGQPATTSGAGTGTQAGVIA